MRSSAVRMLDASAPESRGTIPDTARNARTRAKARFTGDLLLAAELPGLHAGVELDAQPADHAVHVVEERRDLGRLEDRRLVEAVLAHAFDVLELALGRLAGERHRRIEQHAVA